MVDDVEPCSPSDAEEGGCPCPDCCCRRRRPPPPLALLVVVVVVFVPCSSSYSRLLPSPVVPKALSHPALSQSLVAVGSKRALLVLLLLGADAAAVVVVVVVVVAPRPCF